MFIVKSMYIFELVCLNRTFSNMLEKLRKHFDVFLVLYLGMVSLFIFRISVKNLDNMFFIFRYNQ